MTTYAFVDLGYFLREFESFTRFVFPDSKDDRPDMPRLQYLLDGASRMFIYYAAEQEGSGATDARQAERLARQREVIDWLSRVQRHNGVHVRWGDVKHKPRKKERIQKRVDVMLAVDMMKHAYRRTMDHAVLLTGDLDFQPLVEELVETGGHVTVAACRWSSADPLLDAADGVIELDSIELAGLVSRSARGAIVRAGNVPHDGPTLHARGQRGVATLGTFDSTGRFLAKIGDPAERFWLSDARDLLQKVVLYELDAEQWTTPNM